MRVIKFRAWDRDRLTMEYWLLHDGKLLYPISEHEQHYKQEWNVMQFTGLTDKNGKEIYEGDVLKPEYRDTPHIVTWDDKRPGFNVGGYGTWEVIGNIYENAELLK